MSKTKGKRLGMCGAVVQYCGHDGCFIADVIEVAGACVVKGNGPITPANIIRDGSLGKPTHHLLDFPRPVFWQPRIGVFVVPSAQLRRVS